MSTLVFEDLSALRAALDAGLVPATIQAAPVAFAYDDDGKLLLEPSEDVARGDRKRLRDAGIELRRRKVRDGLALSCWAAIRARGTPGWRWAALAGGAVALTALTRGEGIGLAALSGAAG